MKRTYDSTEQLKSGYGINKRIPHAYEEVILKTLSHFPELRDTKINFELRTDKKRPHSTEPSFFSILPGMGKRSYTIHILEVAVAPEDKRLLKNLPYEARVAAIAHELAHVLQFEKSGAGKALKMVMHGRDSVRERERMADISVIEHGLGFELYTYATYLRTIDDYPEHKKSLDVNHLHPNEILDALPPEQLQDVHRF